MCFFQYFQDSGLFKMGWTKIVQIWAKVIFHENGHVPKSQDMLFSRNKSPCGSVPQKVTFSELTLRELIHFYRDFKNQLFPKNRDFDDNLPIKFQFLPKTKMVRMVHRNNFCEMGLEISDQKKELWTKTVFWEGWEISKFSFEVQGGLLRVSTGPKLILKIFWTIPESF